MNEVNQSINQRGMNYTDIRCFARDGNGTLEEPKTMPLGSCVASRRWHNQRDRERATTLVTNVLLLQSMLHFVAIRRPQQSQMDTSPLDVHGIPAWRLHKKSVKLYSPGIPLSLQATILT